MPHNQLLLLELLPPILRVLFHLELHDFISVYYIVPGGCRLVIVGLESSYASWAKLKSGVSMANKELLQRWLDHNLFASLTF